MKKILKVLKWFFIVLITAIIWLFITIYISSLNSYKESDFNIPKDFFKTKYADKDPLSKENWFNDLVAMNNALTIKGDNFNTKSWTLDKDINLWYFSILWRCIFDEKYKKQCEKDKDNYFNKKTTKSEKEKTISTSLEKLKILSKEINEKYEKKIMNKSYILSTYEYVSYYIYFDAINIHYYISSNNYLAYIYFKKWDYEKWINILLNNQKFMNYLLNNSDWIRYNLTTLLLISSKNLSTIEYIINNFKLDIKLKEKIKNELNNKIKLWFIRNIEKNALKEDLILLDSFFKNNNELTFLDKIKYKLFYSEKETKILLKNSIYNIINNKNRLVINKNINNYYGRIFYNIWKDDNERFTYIIKYVKDNQKLREDLINQVTSSIEESKKQILEEDKSLNKIDIKDLWNWFELKQMKNVSLLMYKWSTIYMWSHIIKKSPFIWDEWCDKYFKKLYKSNDKQQAWDSLNSDEQKLCMKEYLNRSISVKTTNNTWFYIIKKQNYESSSIFLYDVKNKNIKKWKYWDNISKIESINNKTYILYNWNRWCSWWIVSLKNKEETILFSNNCDVDLNNIPDDYKKVIDFKLLWDWNIKIIYNWWRNRENKELILK